MNVTKRRDYGNQENIFKLVEEYCELIRLSSPSDIELGRIEKILELAVYDRELNNLINQADEKYVIENNLLRDDYLTDNYSSILESNYLNSLSEIDDKNNLDKAEDKNKDNSQNLKNLSNVVLFPRLFTPHLEKKRKILDFDITLVISCVAGVILTFFGVAELHNSFDNEKDLSSKHSSIFPSKFDNFLASYNTNNYLLSYVNNTEEMSVCNPNDDIPNQDMKKYYASFKELENQIETQKLPLSEVKYEVRYLQVKAERQQRKAEENQRYAEINKHQAEIQSRYNEAQKLKDEAQTSLSESQQWLCLSRQTLKLSMH